MNKKEIIWREILFQATNNKKLEFTQKELAGDFGFSLSTVFNALKIPRQVGIIEVGGKSFKVQDIEKFLYLWATYRNLEKEIIYKTSLPLSVKEIEGLVPPFSVFACYSAFLKRYKESPADYDKVYIYNSENKIEEVKKRFPFNKGYFNLIVFKKDSYLSNFGEITPDIQTFVDLWNLKDWYAKDFLDKLKDKIL